MEAHSKGLALEDEVGQIIWPLVHRFYPRVSCLRQPRVPLQSGEAVVPDFDLKVELPFATLHYFIECQDRDKNSKDILHKVAYIRSKQWRNTFIFVYRDYASPGTLAALKTEGIMALDLEGLRKFVAGLEETLGATLPPHEPIPDQGMLAGG